MLTEDDGIELLKLARNTVERYFSDKKIKIEETRFGEKSGVFVTIKTLDGELCGCIGYPYPVYPLGEAVQMAAISAAFEDPRFPPLKKEMLNYVLFEISVLTKPKIIKVNKTEDYLKEIELGKDGLIVQRGFNSGLLLPQVALEYNMSLEEFLEHTYYKAGLDGNAWKDKNTKIYKFQVQIFKELPKH